MSEVSINIIDVYIYIYIYNVHYKLCRQFDVQSTFSLCLVLFKKKGEVNARILSKYFNHLVSL